MIKQLILFIFISVFLGLSQTAGVGGGPIINILLMISMDYHAKLSISITYIFLIGGSIASIWKNASKINPKTNSSYINMDIILLTVPTMSSGALFGGVIKNFLSQLIITILFVILFVYIIYDLKTTIKKLKMQKNIQLITIKPQHTETQKAIQPSFQQSQIREQQTNTITPAYKDQKVKLVIKMGVGYYIFTVLISLLRGGVRYKSIIGINPCGFWGWVILGLHFGGSALFAYRVANFIISGQQNSLSSQLVAQSHGSDVNKDNVQYFLIAGFCAGLLGATLAIGGALVLIPIWLKLGIDKQVIVSTTPTLILISAMVAFTIALFNGQYQQISTFVLIFYLILAFVSAAVVKDVVTVITNKYKLKSLVLVLLQIVVMVSLLTLVPYQGLKMSQNFEDFVNFGRFC